MRRMSASRAGRVRATTVGAAALLAGLVLIVVLVPFLLRPARTVLPAAPTSAPATMGPAHSVVPPSPVVTEAPVPPSATAPAPERPPATTQPLPIVERRHVQPGTTLPKQLREDATPPPATPPEREWDRSAAARRRAIERYGGTPRTENAVEAGLGWLAAHQSRSGLWDRLAFDRECPPGDRCVGVAVRRTDNDLRAGITGLALLAFLGAGYTDRDGPHADVVRRGVDALLALQQQDGGFSRDESMATYNDALATLALAEHYALVQDERVRAPLRRGALRLVASQQERGGWDYGRSPLLGRNDTSISAWAVQALQAARAAGVDVPPVAFVKAALHFRRATERDGRIRYADVGKGVKLGDDLQPEYRHGPAMLAAGLMCKQMLGWRMTDGVAARHAAMVQTDLPSSAEARGRDPTQLHNAYYWYYGTLAMFQRGGDDWSRWNARLRDALLPLQDRTERGDRRDHQYGSWRPFGAGWGMFGRMGGRVYSTAISTLTLEIYYRHTPAFLTDALPYRAADWRAYLRGVDERERLTVVACLAELRVELSEPVLIALLEDPYARVQLEAALGLVGLDSPRGGDVIAAALPDLTPFEQQRARRALERVAAIRALPPATGTLRLYDADTRLATVALPRSYVGMQLEVLRDGRRVALLRVVQRFTGRNVIVAQRLDAAAKQPARGDRVSELR
jgi:hypothetical protein